MFHQGHGIGILAKNTCKAKDFAGVVEETEEEQNLDEAIDNWMRSSSSAQNEYEILNSLLLEGGEANA